MLLTVWGRLFYSVFSALIDLSGPIKASYDCYHLNCYCFQCMGWYFCYSSFPNHFSRICMNCKMNTLNGFSNIPHCPMIYCNVLSTLVSSLYVIHIILICAADSCEIFRSYRVARYALSGISPLDHCPFLHLICVTLKSILFYFILFLFFLENRQYAVN